MWVNDYGIIGMQLGVGLGIGMVAILLSYMLGAKKGESEKLTAFECGFDSFEDARVKFEVRYYIVGLLFVVFDVEATYLIPWSIGLGRVGSTGYWCMVDFIVELTVGLVYAWRLGLLEWSGLTRD